MADDKPVPEKKEKSRVWMDILTVVAMPLVTAVIGFTINSSLNDRQQRENNLRLYADMMTKREQADSDLRKDMFTSILDKFTSTQPDPKSPEYLEQEVVNLELLASNFNESMDLGPLFKHVRRQIPDSPKGAVGEAYKRYDDLRSRLETVAIEVNERQLTVVGDSGVVVRAGVDDLAHAADTGSAYLRFLTPMSITRPGAKSDESITQVCLTMPSTDKNPHFRRFKLEVTDFRAETRELMVRLYASKPLDEATCKSPDLDLKGVAEIDSKFWVGIFDFPMIDNTRLTHSERAAVTVTELTPEHAEITLAFFPSSRASLKDKPYFDELEHDLRGSSGDK